MSHHATRLLRLAIAPAAVLTLACADAATAPTPSLAPVQRTLSIEGDTLDCRNGWTVSNGKYLCNPS